MIITHPYIEERYFRMTKYFDPDLSEEILETYQGYSLQVFASGRSKLSFHRSHKDRAEYYAVKPKRFREAYRRQYDRSAPEGAALKCNTILNQSVNY